MIKLIETSRIYVLCPFNVVTGGAELLHQLVHVLNNNNREAFIYYYNADQSPDLAIPVPYRIYNIRLATSIEDNSKNVVVLFEAIFDRINSIKYAQIILWWLSVDNFFIFSRNYLSFYEYYKFNLYDGIKETIKKLTYSLYNPKSIFKKSINLKKIKEKSTLSCYQSEYAHHFLMKNNFKEILPLSDYINIKFITNEININRENKILYNPRKGLKFTEKLIRLAPHLKWVPLENMDTDELVKEFRTSKIYIDFGYHPGKDRIPREAALNGCCIMTNTKGSAFYFEDVSIPEKYKINTDYTTKQEIISSIEEILENFNDCVKDFHFYRKRISKEEEIFVRQIGEIFDLK